MIVPVRVRERMQRIVPVYTEFLRRDEDRSARSEGNVAPAVAHGPGPHGRRRIVSGSGHDLDGSRKIQFRGHRRQYGPHRLVRLIDLRQLFLADPADFHHLSGPAAVLHVKDQHAGGVGYVRTVDAGQPVGNIILGQHDLRDLRKVLRLFILHPQNLRGGKTGKGNIRRIFGQLLPADDIVQVITLFISTAVVPQKRRADHVVLPVENHQSVHLPSETDSRHLAAVTVLQKFLQPRHGFPIPVLRILLRPARMRETDRIFAGYNLLNPAFPVHQKQLHGRGSKVHSYIKHLYVLLSFSFSFFHFSFFAFLTCTGTFFSYITSFRPNFQQMELIFPYFGKTL